MGLEIDAVAALLHSFWVRYAVHNKRFYAEQLFIRIHGARVLPSDCVGFASYTFSPVVGGVDSQA
jgi:hypothetical protein